MCALANRNATKADLSAYAVHDNPRHHAAVDTNLTAIKVALADITDTELAALIAATYGVPQTAPGLLAWIEGACD